MLFESHKFLHASPAVGLVPRSASDPRSPHELQQHPVHPLLPEPRFSSNTHKRTALTQQNRTEERCVSANTSNVPTATRTADLAVPSSIVLRVGLLRAEQQLSTEERPDDGPHASVLEQQLSLKQDAFERSGRLSSTAGVFPAATEACFRDAAEASQIESGGRDACDCNRQAACAGRPCRAALHSKSDLVEPHAAAAHVTSQQDDAESVSALRKGDWKRLHARQHTPPSAEKFDEHKSHGRAPPPLLCSVPHFGVRQAATRSGATQSQINISCASSSSARLLLNPPTPQHTPPLRPDLQRKLQTNSISHLTRLNDTTSLEILAHVTMSTDSLPSAQTHKVNDTSRFVSSSSEPKVLLSPCWQSDATMCTSAVASTFEQHNAQSEQPMRLPSIHALTQKLGVPSRSGRTDPTANTFWSPKLKDFSSHKQFGFANAQPNTESQKKSLISNTIEIASQNKQLRSIHSQPQRPNIPIPNILGSRMLPPPNSQLFHEKANLKSATESSSSSLPSLAYQSHAPQGYDMHARKRSLPQDSETMQQASTAYKLKDCADDSEPVSDSDSQTSAKRHRVAGKSDSDSTHYGLSHTKTVACLLKPVITSAGEKIFACPHCPKVFNRKYNLQSHLLVHTSDRPFECTYCPSNFARKHDLQRHIRSRHTIVRPHICTFCPLSFARSDGLKRHLENESRNPDPTNPHFNAFSFYRSDSTPFVFRQ